MSKRRWFLVAAAAFALFAAGCGRGGSVYGEISRETALNMETAEKDSVMKSEEIAESYRTIYQQASERGTLEDLETVRAIVEFLGKNGYTAVDNENQIDMVNPARVRAFAKSVETKETDKLTILCVMSGGGFIRYDLQTLDGSVDVTVSSLLWNNKVPQVNDQERYPAHVWSFTDNGYLFFDRYHMPGICWGHTAIRVEPLDETCRELNRTYIRPVGYSRNNLFITDWSEEDLGDLDLYDFFDRMYEMKYKTGVPYIATDEGQIYEISKNEFEAPLLSYLGIKSSAIEQNASFRQKDGVYEYRPRGLYDNGQDEESPYPEVVSYQKNSDGTITLTVQAVLPHQYLEDAFTHQVVIRPTENGGFQYGSNKVVNWREDVQPQWYVKRMTKEEWDDFYSSDRAE